MNFNPNDFLPKRNNWFSKKVRYEGLGRAEFIGPKGWVEGQVTIRYDESGHETITMQVDEWRCEESPEIENAVDDYYLLWMLNGVPPKKIGDSLLYATRSGNKCSKLIVNTKSGVFQNYGRVLYQHDVRATRHIEFSIHEALYESNAIPDAKFWVMPLTNFISENLRLVLFRTVGTPLYQHPLRRWKFPSIPEDIDDDSERQLIYQLNSQSIIPFEYNNTLAFIEPLHKYDELRNRLSKGTVGSLITAVMVGEIGSHPIGSSAINDWIPLDLLSCLSLISGSSVGAPWIEIRDVEGRLVQRIHNSQRTSRFHNGHTTINGFCSGGISHLLSSAPDDLGSHLRVAIELVVKGGQDLFDPADSLDFFFRAFDTLTKNFRHSKRNVPIEPERLSRINHIVQDAQLEIVKIGNETVDKEKAAIKNIAHKVSIAAQPTRNSEAEGLIELVNSLNLNDFKDVISDVDTWTQLYTKYRTQIIHESFFSRHTNTNNIDEIAYLYRYLHDLLIRIILKSLNYSGEYLSPIAVEHKVFIDWVTPQTTPRELGIGRKLIL